jgi:hypothetical protein
MMVLGYKNLISSKTHAYVKNCIGLDARTVALSRYRFMNAVKIIGGLFKKIAWFNMPDSGLTCHLVFVYFVEKISIISIISIS